MALAGTYWATPVLRVGDRVYTWRDVVLFAMAAGEWPDFETRLRQGLACETEADRAAAWPDPAVLDEAATAFRYERDLLTSEETEAWLAARGLDIDQWSAALARGVLRAAWRDRLASLDPGTLDPAEVPATVLVAEGVCSGAFDRWAAMLGARAALASSAGISQPPAPEGDLVVARHAAWVAGDNEAATALRHLADVVAADRAVATSALTDEALDLHLERCRLDWVRVDVECLSFPTDAAAREAALCVREDGLSLSEVAVESGQPIVDHRTVLDTLEPALRDAVLSASPGDTIGPLALDAGFTVVHVVGKAAATLNDPLVRARAERSVVDTLRERALVSAVQWLLPRPV